MRNRKGFTLIELLVVIAIIGILATLVVVAVNGAQVRARNSQAKNDVTQMGKAIELFKVNQIPATLPQANGTAVGNVRTATITGTTATGNFAALFNGTEGAGSYGIRITTAPSGLTYRHVTASVADMNYSVWTNAIPVTGGNETSLCVHNGSTLTAAPAVAPSTATIDCDTDVIP